jgi:RHS repeat-associated protein
MTSRADAAGTSTYTWDSLGRLGTLTDPLTGVTASRGYDVDSQLTAITYGTGGATRTRTYDDLHRLTGDTLKTPAGATQAATTYAYDLNDNVTSRTTSGLAGAGSDSFTYDQADRLSSWIHQATTVPYTYDAAGNRTGIGGRSQTFDARGRITSATDGTGTTTYTWTPRGTLTGTSGAATRTVTYDAFDQMASDTATTGTGSGPQAYSYDALGRRVTAAPTGSGTGPTSALTYSGLGHDLAGDGTSTYALDPDGGLTATRTGTSSTLALTDRHEDVVGAFTATGTAPIASAAYDPLGNVTAHTGTMPTQVGWQSEWTDPATAQVDLWHRTYDPTSGLFDSPDPIDQNPNPDSVAAAPYTYGLDDPLDRADPTGQIACADEACHVVYTNDPASIDKAEKQLEAEDKARKKEQQQFAHAMRAFALALSKVVDKVVIDQATARALQPARTLSKSDVRSLESELGNGIYPVLKMAADCASDYTEELCRWRHKLPITNYMDATTCTGIGPTRCVVTLGVEAALARFGVKLTSEGQIAALVSTGARNLGRAIARSIGRLRGIPDVELPIGFTEDTVSSAYQNMNKGGGHAIRHFEEEGLISNRGSLSSRVQEFEEKTRHILAHPEKTFNWSVRGTKCRAFIGEIDGTKVVLFVAKEGPYVGKVLSAGKVKPEQAASWGIKLK